MVVYKEFLRICETGTLDEAAELLLALRPDLANTVKLILTQRGLGRLKALLEAERSNPKIQRKKITVAVTVGADPRLPATEDEVAESGFEYPDYYPPVLQQLLIKASGKVGLKRRLSNSLFKVLDKPAALKETIDQILKLSGEIDEAYSIKKNFDKHGELPEHLLAPVEKLSNDFATIDRELKLCRSRISKLKAKLNNPREVMEGGHKVREWRQKLEEEESQRVELMEKWMMLKQF